MVELVLQGDEVAQRRDLRRMKARATALLVAAGAVFVAARLLEDRHHGWGFLRATAEAAMVGGLADWFAVTALFRRPLGLPIPHTALIPTRKDALGKSLGNFVEHNFLAGDAVIERLRAAQISARLAAWLVSPGNAATVSRHTAAALAGASDVLADDELAAALEQAVVERLRQVDVAPLAGKALSVATAEGRHRPLIDSALVGALHFVDEQREQLRTRFARESPWWVPEQIDDRIFTKLYSGLRAFLLEVSDTPNHPVRRHLDQRLEELVERLQSDPALGRRVEGLA